MVDQKRIVILGGHGKIALLAAPKLAAAGFAVDSAIRNADHSDDVQTANAHPVLFDLEQADVADLESLFEGASAVVFSAGAGGGNPDRTHAVDYVAATYAIDAAENAGVERFVMVSYARAASDIERLETDNSFYPYAKAKHDADEHLRASQLNYTILGPGALTLEEASGKIQLADATGDIPGLDAKERVTSRENVAEVITHVLTTGAAAHGTVNFYDGSIKIEDAIH
ncbi:MAG: NAD(P)H-binding protein [Canibacter sp.]